jgi:hypothetical protein
MPPQKSPSNLDSSRNKALEIGTDKSKFHTDLPYDHTGGFPTGTPGNGGSAKDNVGPGMIDPGPLPTQPKPFK